MRLDPLGPDWSSLAPIAGFGAIERTAYGFRTSCEAGPIEVAAFAPGIFRLTLGEPSGPDFGILEAAPAPQDVEVDETRGGRRAERGQLCACCCGAGRCVSSWPGAGRPCCDRPPTARSASSCACRAFARTRRGLARGAGARERRGGVRSRREMGPARPPRPAPALAGRGRARRQCRASYKNTPFAWSPRGWGLFVHTAATVTHGVGHPGLVAPQLCPRGRGRRSICS